MSNNPTELTPAELAALTDEERKDLELLELIIGHGQAASPLDVAHIDRLRRLAALEMEVQRLREREKQATTYRIPRDGGKKNVFIQRGREGWVVQMPTFSKDDTTSLCRDGQWKCYEQIDWNSEEWLYESPDAAYAAYEQSQGRGEEGNHAESK